MIETGAVILRSCSRRERLGSTPETARLPRCYLWLRTLLPMRETWEMQVQFLSRKGPLEEGMATHFSILSWRIPWKGEPGGLQYMALQRIRHDWSVLACTHTRYSLGKWEFATKSRVWVVVLKTAWKQQCQGEILPNTFYQKSCWRKGWVIQHQSRDAGRCGTQWAIKLWSETEDEEF